MAPKADIAPPSTESPKAETNAPPSPSKTQSSALAGIDYSQPSMTGHKFKSDIVFRIGGESMFEFILIAFVENLKSDKKLARFYENFDAQSLRIHQRTFLLQVFEEPPEGQKEEDIDSIIALRHYTLINQGFRGKHFDLLVNHFVHAMDDSWVSEDVIKDAVCILYPFRRVFVSDGEEIKSVEGMELLFPTINREGDDDIQVTLNDEAPPSRLKKKRPTRASSNEGLASMKSSLSRGGRGGGLLKQTLSGEGLAKMKQSLGKTFSGEGLAKMKKSIQRRVSGERIVVPDEVKDAAGEDY